MPALPAVPKTIRLDHNFTSSPNSNIFTRNFIQYTGVLSLADANTWLATLVTAFGNRWKAHMSSAVSYGGSTLTDLNSSTGVQTGLSAAVAGTVINAVVSNSTCVVVEWEIARRYKGGKARSYMPGGPASLTLDTESWTNAAVVNWRTDFNGWVADMAVAPPVAVGSATPVAVSYYQGFTTVTRTPLRARNVNTVRANPLVDPILGCEVRIKFGTQRRRLQAS